MLAEWKSAAYSYEQKVTGKDFQKDESDSLRYQSNGYNIVLDINSGCIHLVDLVTYEVLPFMEEGLSEQEIVDKLKDQYPEADIRTSVSECEKLKEQVCCLPEIYTKNIIDEFTENRQTVVKALCLHIAHDCNLACRYCFAEEGEYHGRRALMSFEVGKKALDFLIANSGSRKNLEVDFFGGEPDELAGCQRPGGIRKRAGETS